MAIHEGCKNLLALKKSGVLRTYDWNIDFEHHLPWMTIRTLSSLPPELSHLYCPRCFSNSAAWTLKEGVWQDETYSYCFLGDHLDRVFIRPIVDYLEDEIRRIEIYSQNGMVLIAFIEELGLKVSWTNSDCYDSLKGGIKIAGQLVDWAYSRRK